MKLNHNIGEEQIKHQQQPGLAIDCHWPSLCFYEQRNSISRYHCLLHSEQSYCLLHSEQSFTCEQSFHKGEMRQPKKGQRLSQTDHEDLQRRSQQTRRRVVRSAKLRKLKRQGHGTKLEAWRKVSAFSGQLVRARWAIMRERRFAFASGCGDWCFCVYGKAS